MEKAGVKEDHLLIPGIIKAEADMNICQGQRAAASSTAREFKSPRRSFPFHGLMVLDNTNYNQNMYFVSTASKALSTVFTF